MIFSQQYAKHQRQSPYQRNTLGLNHSQQQQTQQQHQQQPSSQHQTRSLLQQQQQQCNLSQSQQLQPLLFYSGTSPGTGSSMNNSNTSNNNNNNNINQININSNNNGKFLVTPNSSTNNNGVAGTQPPKTPTYIMRAQLQQELRDALLKSSLMLQTTSTTMNASSSQEMNSSNSTSNSPIHAQNMNLAMTFGEEDSIDEFESIPNSAQIASISPQNQFQQTTILGSPVASTRKSISQLLHHPLRQLINNAKFNNNNQDNLSQNNNNNNNNNNTGQQSTIQTTTGHGNQSSNQKSRNNQQQQQQQCKTQSDQQQASRKIQSASVSTVAGTPSADFLLARLYQQSTGENTLQRELDDSKQQIVSEKKSVQLVHRKQIPSLDLKQAATMRTATQERISEQVNHPYCSVRFSTRSNNLQSYSQQSSSNRAQTQASSNYEYPSQQMQQYHQQQNERIDTSIEGESDQQARDNSEIEQAKYENDVDDEDKQSEKHTSRQSLKRNSQSMQRLQKQSIATEDGMRRSGNSQVRIENKKRNLFQNSMKAANSTDDVVIVAARTTAGNEYNSNWKVSRYTQTRAWTRENWFDQSWYSKESVSVAAAIASGKCDRISQESAGRNRQAVTTAQSKVSTMPFQPQQQLQQQQQQKPEQWCKQGSLSRTTNSWNPAYFDFMRSTSRQAAEIGDLMKRKTAQNNHNNNQCAASNGKEEQFGSREGTGTGEDVREKQSEELKRTVSVSRESFRSEKHFVIKKNGSCVSAGITQQVQLIGSASSGKQHQLSNSLQNGLFSHSLSGGVGGSRTTRNSIEHRNFNTSCFESAAANVASYSNHVTTAITAVGKGRNQQDSLDESVQPWSRKGSQGDMDISIF